MHRVQQETLPQQISRIKDTLEEKRGLLEKLELKERQLRVALDRQAHESGKAWSDIGLLQKHLARSVAQQAVLEAKIAKLKSLIKSIQSMTEDINNTQSKINQTSQDITVELERTQKLQQELAESSALVTSKKQKLGRLQHEYTLRKMNLEELERPKCGTGIQLLPEPAQLNRKHRS